MNDEATAVSDAPASTLLTTPAAPPAVGENVSQARLKRSQESLEALAKRLESAPPVRKFGFRAPNWLQATVIFAIFGAALFVAVNEHYLWAGILAVAGTAFGVSYILRRMIGDEYDRA